MSTLLKAFGMILLAELGDKTQFLAIGFATKYKIKYVLIGIFTGAFLNHFLAMMIGQQIKQYVDNTLLGIIAGVIFVLFSWWNLSLEKDDDPSKMKDYGAVLTVAIAFFLGELGDKTQIAVIVLSIDSGYPFITVIGAVLGMVAIGYLGILIGIKLGDKIPEFYMKLSSFALFGIVGSIKIYNSIPTAYHTVFYISLYCITYGLISAYFVYRRYQFEQRVVTTKLKRQSETLYQYYQELQGKLNNLCLNCLVCDKNECLLGYTKYIVKRSLENEPVTLETLNEKLIKKYDYIKLRQAYETVLEALKNHWDNDNLQSIRASFELILFKKQIQAESYSNLTHRLKTQTEV